jgi:hypothetical protein
VWRRKWIPPEGDNVDEKKSVDAGAITTKPAQVFQNGVSPKESLNPRNAAKMPGVGGDHGRSDGCLRVA